MNATLTTMCGCRRYIEITVPPPPEIHLPLSEDPCLRSGSNTPESPGPQKPTTVRVFCLVDCKVPHYADYSEHAP